MAIPNVNYGELAASTLEKRQKEFADNITNHIPLLKFIEAKGNRKVAGGRLILEEISYADNGTASFYTAYDPLDITPQNVFSAAQYDWKQAAVSITWTGLEQNVQNTGPEAVIKLLTARIKNANISMANMMGAAVFSDGTGFGGKEIGGLQLLVADDPTTSAVVGGINQADNAFWRNQAIDTNLSAGNIVSYMNQLLRDCTFNSYMPDIIVADDNLYGMYEENVQDIQRITKDDTAEAGLGFQSLRFKGIPVIRDVNCPTNHMYMLNTNFLQLNYAAERNYVADPKKTSFNQDAYTMPILWAGNTTCSGRRYQGVLLDS